jgi:hypothetical protein
MTALRERGIVAGEGGTDDGRSRDVVYRLTSRGREELSALGVDMDRLPRRRSAIRYCVDWGEQRHHLAGALGAALTGRMFALDWLRRGKYRRAVRLTDAGRDGLARTFGIPAGQLPS